MSKVDIWGGIPIEVICGTGSFGSGKAQPLHCKILTPTGWTTMGQIKPGDVVVNPHGGDATVVATFPQGRKPVFTVTLNDGSTTQCCEDHLWFVQTVSDRSTKAWSPGRVLSLRDVRSRPNCKFYVPLVEPVTFDSTAGLCIDPYLLGLIIGDGCISHGLAISNPEPEIQKSLSELLAVHGVSLCPTRGNPSRDFYITSGVRGGDFRDTNSLLIKLRVLGLHGKRSTQKFIPDEYMTACVYDRLSLLQGLCDTDGHADHAGWCEYSTSSPVLARQVRELVWSLGGTASMASRIPAYTYRGERKAGAESFRLGIRLPSGMNPFRIERKASVYDQHRLTEPTRRIADITSAGDAECQCILLDSQNHLYVTDDYIITHNTLFGLTIDPGPRTLVFDNEGSSTCYQSIGFTHIDMAAELSVKHPKGYKPSDRWQHWRDRTLEMGRTGNFTVLMTDPISEVEQGLADYIDSQPQNFGYTRLQFQKSAGLFWGVVKSVWKQHLDQLRTMYSTVYLVTHLRAEFRGNAPTGKKEPKGKETLFELASLYLWFDRAADKKGNVPAVPSANVLKSRLSHARIGADGAVEIVPILPPRLPKATPQAIREYIAAPPDYAKLKSDERYREQEMTEDEKLVIQAQIAEANKETEQAKLSQLAEMKARAIAEAEAAKHAPAVPPASDRSAQLAVDSTARTASSVPVMCRPEQEAQIKAHLKLAFENVMQFKAILDGYGVAKIAQLTEGQANDVLIELLELIAQREQAKQEELAAAAAVTAGVVAPVAESDAGSAIEASTPPAAAQAQEATAQPVVDVSPHATTNGEVLTAEQYDRLRGLVQKCQWPRDKQEQFLRNRGVASWRSITRECAAALIDKLAEIADGFDSTSKAPKN